MSSSGAEPLLPAGRFAPHRREQPGAILGTSFANSACAIACRSMVYRWLRIQVPASALQCIALADGRNALAAANDRALNGAVYSAALALTPQHVVERKDGKTGSRRALRARAGWGRARSGSALLQGPVLGEADSERRNCPGVRGVLSEVPDASMSAAGVTRLAIAGCTEAEIATIPGHSLRDVNEKARLHHAARRRRGGGKHRHYDVDISSKNLSNHWNACCGTSVARVC